MECLYLCLFSRLKAVLFVCIEWLINTSEGTVSLEVCEL